MLTVMVGVIVFGPCAFHLFPFILCQHGDSRDTKDRRVKKRRYQQDYVGFRFYKIQTSRAIYLLMLLADCL